MFIVFLSSIVNASNHIKCVLLRHQKCTIQPTLINLHRLHKFVFQIKQKIQI